MPKQTIDKWRKTKHGSDHKQKKQKQKRETENNNYIKLKNKQNLKTAKASRLQIHTLELKHESGRKLATLIRFSSGAEKLQYHKSPTFPVQEASRAGSNGFGAIVRVGSKSPFGAKLNYKLKRSKLYFVY